MNLYSFVYDKQDGEPARRRYVGVTTCDNIYIKGYDLEDRVHKTFLTSKIVGQLSSHGSYDPSVLLNSDIVRRDEVFKLLNWNYDYQTVFKDIGGTDEQLEKVVYTKTGKNIFHLQGDDFLLLGNAEVVVNINVGETDLKMKIREGIIEYFEGSVQLTPLEFTRKVLGV